MIKNMSAEGGSVRLWRSGNFKKDILLIDCEFSGFDIQKHEILQLAGVLLDKRTLKEKKYFSSYIRPGLWKNRDRWDCAFNRPSPIEDLGVYFSFIFRDKIGICSL